MSIKVIDSLCGSGKTTFIFEHMKQNKDKKWIFVSPYLKEVGDEFTQGRIKTELPELNFVVPVASPTKTASFERLVKKGHNIAITHSLFIQFSPAIAKLIKEQEYHLVIDETIDLVTFYEDLSTEDVEVLILAGMVVTGEKGKLCWNEERFPNYVGRDSRIKQLCELECLWLYGDNVLIQRIPPAIINACSSVYILTYLFSASLMRCWMDLNQVEWEYYYPDSLLDAKSLKSKIREHLKIVDIPKPIKEIQTDKQGKLLPYTFSSSWYKRVAPLKDGQLKEESKILNKMKESMSNVVRESFPKGKVFWTTFKAYEGALVNTGYKRARKNEEGVLLSPFVPKNMRASNEYRGFSNCIYTINIYPHTSVVEHLASFGIYVDKDEYALSELIQFIFRGSIRLHKDMYVCILSQRMENILRDWVEKEE